jgi:hypothetical protein
MTFFPHVIIIAGNGRNVGKTTFATKILQKFSSEISIASLKISPHFHDSIGSNYKLVSKGTTFSLYRDYELDSGKDSSRLLKAGAHRSFYLQVYDNDLKDTLPVIEKNIDFDNPVICESGWLRKILHPGLFFLVNHINNTTFNTKAEDLKTFVDKVVHFDGKSFDFDVDKIRYNKSGWQIE